MSRLPTSTIGSAGYTIGQQNAVNSGQQQSNQKRRDLLEQDRPKRRTRLRQVVDQQLIDAGIDPTQTRIRIDEQSRRLEDMKRERVALGQRRRELERAGRTDEAEALRREMRNLRISEKNLIHGSGDDLGLKREVRLISPSLSRLPVQEQQQIRARGREKLNALLAESARGAEAQADRAQVASDEFIANLARRAYFARTGYEPNFESEASAADYFRALPQEEQERYTRGVPLPDPSGAQANARRLRTLAETGGINFSDRELTQRTIDPIAARREADRQEIDFYARETAGDAARREIGRQDLESRTLLTDAQTANRQAGINLNNVERNDRVGDAEAEAAIADAQQREVRSNVVRAIDEATEDAQIQTALDQLSPADKADLSTLPDDMPIERRVQLEFGVADEIASLQGSAASDETISRLENVSTKIRIASESLTPEQRRAWARRTLDKISTIVPLEAGGFGPTLGQAVIRGARTVIGAGNAGPTDTQIQAEELRARIIRELQSMAGANE